MGHQSHQKKNNAKCNPITLKLLLFVGHLVVSISCVPNKETKEIVQNCSFHLHPQGTGLFFFFSSKQVISKNKHGMQQADP